MMCKLESLNSSVKERDVPMISLYSRQFSIIIAVTWKNSRKLGGKLINSVVKSVELFGVCSIEHIDAGEA